MLVTSLILFAVLSRVLPHPANMTAIAAVALFGSFRFNSKIEGLFVPVAAMLVSDIALEILYRVGVNPFAGFHTGMWHVYLAVTLISFIGFWLKSATKPGYLEITKLAGASIVSSFVFFIVTNFGVWLGSGYYPQNMQGLTLCYVAALPFLRNQITGDLFFTTVIFGSYFASLRYFEAENKISIKL
ncbi:MAG: DUF6580 family putative transport protein [Chloroherpetonaceae bacterium]|nr:DUF6580 family putative transport protein [Chloroherpetonaceae bacterium]